MMIPAMLGSAARDPYAPPARDYAWPEPFPVGGNQRRAPAPAAESAFGPEDDPFRISDGPATARESATSGLRAIWIQHIESSMLEMWNNPTQYARTWLANALEELEEIDREVLQDRLPTIKAETKAEAERILRKLSAQKIQPTTYPTHDGEIVIHFQPPGVPAAVLIELNNDGQAAWFSCVGGKNRRARYSDSSELPDQFVLAQLKALAAERGTW